MILNWGDDSGLGLGGCCLRFEGGEGSDYSVHRPHGDKEERQGIVNIETKETKREEADSQPAHARFTVLLEEFYAVCMYRVYVFSFLVFPLLPWGAYTPPQPSNLIHLKIYRITSETAISTIRQHCRPKSPRANRAGQTVQHILRQIQRAKEPPSSSLFPLERQYDLRPASEETRVV